MKGNALVGGGVTQCIFQFYDLVLLVLEKEMNARLGWRDVKQATHPNPRVK